MIELLRRVSGGHSLTESEAASAMRMIMRGEVSPVRVAGFVMALAARGETVDEITGLAIAAREFATEVPIDSHVLDTCGTGGDGHNTFNISTAAAVVAAACGVRVAKHGNRSASSSCGSADVLEELGVGIEQEPGDAARALETVGIAFLYAPRFHPAFRYVAEARRELGVRSVFNLLGPLCSPARARFRMLGVPSPELVTPMAEVLSRLEVTRALVFHSEDGMDELSLGAPSKVVEVAGDQRREYRLDPTELGLSTTPAADLEGGDRRINADILRRVFTGERGAARDVVLLNTGAALRVAGRVDGWHEGLEVASRAIDSGDVHELLQNWVRTTHDARPLRSLT
ncbi:anthranilate phosphoribosyltransferase [Parasphingorhabdus pacifica]